MKIWNENKELKDGAYYGIKMELKSVKTINEQELTAELVLSISEEAEVFFKKGDMFIDSNGFRYGLEDVAVIGKVMSFINVYGLDYTVEMLLKKLADENRDESELYRYLAGCKERLQDKDVDL